MSVTRALRPPIASHVAPTSIGARSTHAPDAVWRMPSDSLAYTFVCGAVAICAMILPGISGAYLLLILGKYEELTGIVKSLPFVESTHALTTLGVFVCGCVFGLLAFSRLLRWLLAWRWSPTMAALAGFMIGSLYRVWPFQVDTTPEEPDFKLKVFEPVAPSSLDDQTLACAAVALACFVGVLIVDHVAWRRAARGSDD